MIQRAKKKWFLAIFWSLVCWIELILHIVIVLNVFQLSAILPGHEGSFKDHKNAFLNDPKGQKSEKSAKIKVSGQVMAFGWFDWSNIA